MSDLLDLLNNPTRRTRIDPSGFHALLAALPAQSRAAWEMGLGAELSDVPTAPDRILLVGVGGSAIGADLSATLATNHSTTPVQVVRNYRLPPLTANTLVILCSFSGNTEEILHAFEHVKASSAYGIAITTGGVLGSKAAESGWPVLSYEWPGPPRTGIGFGVFILLAVFRRLGVLHLTDGEIHQGFSTLDRVTEANGLSAPSSRAQVLAAWLYGGVPAIIGADMLEVAARRWSGEISENAKQVAAAYGIPEFNHNQLEAAAHVDGVPGPLRFVILDAPAVHPRNRLRVSQTAEMMLAAGREVQVANAGGETPIEAILAACALGSWTSYYLALLREVNPASHTIMDRLKQILAQER
ncbi:MAG: SIS domain-containing protein [Chloroflexi bacterium]|nr:SIS domain-containing protein [Chloroflexota bacterium]